MPSSNDIFLESMREALEQPALTFQQALAQPMAKHLLETIQRGSASLTVEGMATSAEGYADAPPANVPPSPTLMRAAIEDTFEMEDIAADDWERKRLLEISDLVVIGGQRRLRLKDAERAEILDAAQGVGSFKNLLHSAVESDNRPLANPLLGGTPAVVETEASPRVIRPDQVRRPSVWLRRFLSGEYADLTGAPPNELNAAWSARERLRLVTHLPTQVPAVSDLERRVRLAELLEPLRVIIGEEGGWDGAPRRDRFVGRLNELKQLRGFVDELSSHTVLESVQRATNRAASALTTAVTGKEKPSLMIVEARGGLGKSALMAKFLLDHALGQERPFPFAYLDFDRAALDPARPHQILLEIARQVELQFPAARPAFASLVKDLRVELSSVSSAEKAESSATIRDPFARFVELVREHATAFGQRAFLLVLDTMEVVQWNVTAMERLSEIIEQFRSKGLDELRVVACGRADIPELHKGKNHSVKAIFLPLRPLPIPDARAMAEALGSGALGADWKRGWSNAIVAGKPSVGSFLEAIVESITTSPDNIRREPLSIRVAVDIVVKAEASERQLLIHDIASAGVDANSDFVARLYERRIMNHIRDPRAKALAWPGLVIRRLTAEIAREVLAGICRIPPEDAVAAFNALGQEIWMVTREDGEDGIVLRHRPDLRARTLPFMRSKNPEAFSQVAQAAVEYFRTHRQTSDGRENRENRVEWLYHRFLVGEDPREIERDLEPGDLVLLARAESDFTPGSRAASYLTARTASGRLPPRRVRELTPYDALYHLSVTAQSVFALDDTNFDPAALELADRLTPKITGNLTDWGNALSIKTGAWHRVTLSHFLEPNVPDPLLRASLYWMTRAPSPERNRRVDAVMRLRGGTAALERFGFRGLVQAVAMTRMAGSKYFHDLDSQLADLLRRMKVASIPSTQAALRTAIVLGEACRSPAVDLWLQSRRHGSSERVSNPTISLAELRVLSLLRPEVRELFSNIPEEQLHFPTRFADEQTFSAAARAIEQALGGGDAVFEGEAMARVFACRSEDWIVPFAYAAARAIGDRFPSPVAQRMAGYVTGTPDESAYVTGGAFPNDMIVAMRLADEASDLAGFTQLVLTQCDPAASTSSSLKLLIDHHREWAQAISRIVGISPPEASEMAGALPVPDQVPAPGPVRHLDDPQKERWGGLSSSGGRSVDAVLQNVERNTFYFNLIVESTDASVLEGPIKFHLHDSFPRSVITIKRIVDGRRATLSDVISYGVFAVGVQVRNASGQWISLELDLATLPGLPIRFLKR